MMLSTLAALSLIAIAHVHASPLSPPKHQQPAHPSSARPEPCTRRCPLQGGHRYNVLTLLHADLRIIDGVKATVCEYTEGVRCLYDANYGHAIFSVDANVFECPARDELECDQQKLVPLNVPVRRAAAPPSPPPHHNHKGKNDSKSKSKGHGKGAHSYSHGGAHGGNGGHNNNKHGQHRHHKSNAQSTAAQHSDSPFDSLTHNVTHALNGDNNSHAKRAVVSPGVQEAGNAIVQESNADQRKTVDRVYDAASHVPQTGPMIKRGVPEVSGIFVPIDAISNSNSVSQNLHHAFPAITETHDAIEELVQHVDGAVGGIALVGLEDGGHY